MNLNKAQVIGRVARKPEIKALPSGIRVANFVVVSNIFFTTKEGEKKEEAEFHNVIFFGRQAELCEKFLEAGSEVYVEGRLKTRSWQKTDVKQYRTEIVGQVIQFGQKSTSSKGTGGHRKGDDAKDGSDIVPDADHVASKELDGNIEYPTEEINIEDIPF